MGVLAPSGRQLLGAGIMSALRPLYHDSWKKKRLKQKKSGQMSQFPSGRSCRCSDICTGLFLHNMDGKSAELAVQIDILDRSVLIVGSRIHLEGEALLF